MKYFIYLCGILFAYNSIFCLPVDNKQNLDIPSNVNYKVEEKFNNTGLEYERYLNEVINILESDEAFIKRIENASIEDIKSGKIAGHLDFVDHNIRTKLDELKRIEINNLRSLIKLKNQLNDFGGNEIDGRKWRTFGNYNSIDHLMLKYEHIDHSNPLKFSKEDLQKLIIKASADLEELNQKRREEFKYYEMEKEFQYQKSLKNLTEEEKKKVIKQHNEKILKNKQHQRVHYPGSKQQLEEVWEQQDHMPKEEFNPSTFFSLHDLNGDEYLDQIEVETLLNTEIKKLYDPNNPENDRNEMMEEYQRMREQIYKKADLNRDGLISRKEFIDLTTNPDFNKDEGWKTIDENPVYSSEELKKYQMQREMALQHQYGYYNNDNYYQYQLHPNQVLNNLPVHPAQMNVYTGQMGSHPAQMNVYPGQMGSHPGQVGVNPGQMGSHPGQVGVNPAQMGSHPGQVGVNPGQMGSHPGQVGVNPGQMGSHPGQVGVNPGQVGVNPGQMGSHPGQVGVNPGQMGSHTGQVGVNPGQMGSHPGQVRVNPGQMGSNPGQVGVNPGQVGSHPQAA